MQYEDFTLPMALARFHLKVFTPEHLFPGVQPVAAGEVLREYLKTVGPLALMVNSDKSRSEWLIAPVLSELWKRTRPSIYLLSGTEFTVDPELGLNGTVDFIVGEGPQIWFVTGRVFAVINQGKNENIPGGMGSCAAAMVAAQRFNIKEGTGPETIYGVVTTGSNWRFQKLEGQNLYIDSNEYSISDVNQILGILLHIVNTTSPPAP
jgi:hypothetical protein